MVLKRFKGSIIDQHRPKISMGRDLVYHELVAKIKYQLNAEINWIYTSTLISLRKISDVFFNSNAKKQVF